MSRAPVVNGLKQWLPSRVPYVGAANYYFFIFIIPLKGAAKYHHD